MATEVVSTIRSSGGDYTSLSAWEAGEQGNLVAADEIRTAECYDDWPSGLNDTVAIDGSTTDSTRYMRVTVASGHRHNGIPKSGFHLSASTGSAGRIVYNADDYTRIEWVDAENTGSGGYGFQSASGNQVLFDRCIATAPTGNGRGWSTITSTQVIQQCLAYACGQHGYSFASGVTAAVSNSVAAGCANGFTGGTSAAVLRNCVAYNNTTNYSGTFGGSSSNNATSSGSDDAPGGDSVISVDSTDFVNAAGNDFHLASGSALIGVGTNLYSDFTTDIDGETWPSSGAWDIGFDHYVSAGGGPTNLTGESSTISPGALIADRVISLSGSAVSASAGTITYSGDASLNISLSGTAVTVSPGTLAFLQELALSGSSVSGEAGSVSPGVSLPLAGQSLSAEAGTVTYSADGSVSLSLSGQSVTVSPGDLGSSRSKALSGASVTVSGGTLSVLSGSALITVRAGSWIRYIKLPTA